MKLELTFAELHTPLFLNGTNWGLKLSSERNTKGKLELAYDREHKELLVSSGSGVAIIPTSNVVSMTPKSVSVEQVMAAAKAEAKASGLPISAQVETPMDHVFKGPGRGKKNDKA